MNRIFCCMNCRTACINRRAFVAETATFEENKLPVLIRSYCLLLLCLSAIVAKPQTVSPFVFTHYSTASGLASNEIYRIQQDREGFLWIATNNGLQRFDGIKFKTFRHNDADAASIPGNVLHRLLIDRNDVLWAATDRAEFFVFDKHRFTAKRIPVRCKEPLTLRQSETRLIEDEEGHLFLLVTGHELLMYDRAKGEFSTAAPFIPLRPEWGITSISEQPGTKKYWLGLQGGGIAIYNKATGAMSYWGHNTEHEPAVERIGPKMGFVYSLFDRQGRLWFVRWEGTAWCMLYDAGRKDKPLRGFEFLSDFKTYLEIQNVFEQRNGRIWVKGAQVFAYYNDTAAKFIPVFSSPGTANGIVYEALMALCEDRQGNIWAGTNNEGLYRFNPSAQLFANIAHQNRSGSLGKGTPMSFFEMRNGDILNGNWEDGTLRYNNGLQAVPLGIKMSLKTQSLRDAYVWSLCPSADSNTLWMGAQPGLGQLNRQKREAFFRNPAILQNHTVRQVVEDKSGTLWLGMHNGGLYRWVDPHRTTRDSIVKCTETGTQTVNKLLADGKGRIWVATAADGLFVYEAATGHLLQHINGDGENKTDVPGSAISCLLRYNDTLMIVANESAVYFYNQKTERFTRASFSASLSGYIASMEKDNDGYVWLSTTNLLCRFHPASRAVLLFDRRDGIANDHFVLNSSCKLRDGRLLFGNTTSFIAFDPRTAGAAVPPPVVHITALQMGQEELRTDSVLALDRLLLTPKNNALTVDFSPLEYGPSYPVQYKMEGLDKEWRLADGSNRVVYPYLPAKHYTLKLRSFSSEGKASSVTELRIAVRPPWYQTWWFYALVALGFVAELWWLDRQRGKRKEVMQKVRTDIAANLHEEVNTALNNINILSEIARLKSDREPQKAKEYLEQIHNKSHNMIIALDDMLWSLNPENDAMDKTISRIREFADALMQRHHVLIELLIDKKVEKLELNMKLRHEAFLLFKEGLRSLVEAGTPHCIVHLTTERTKLLFTIEFSNEGCNLQQLNNLLQRHDMDQRIRALKAKLDVQLHKSRSLFLLQLPLG